MPNPSQRSREREIFDAALDIDSAEERRRYLTRACGGDEALLDRVQALLAACEGGILFLPETPHLSRPVPGQELTEQPGDHIGRYRILQQIGEGGCGVVYMAEQEEPVRRRVALKVIKRGMDTKQVIARFDAERQALALMNHPNIAKVLDAGATKAGRPYFVMELVRGVKITEFCDEERLGTRERLHLFVQVCHALQHAHQNGVIHRDIKPSNVLVTVNDGVPVPKVIDFGIAKATAGRLTDKTLFTAFEQFLGTPAYMSPEQAEMSSLDVDTRADIYSLGVLLYELLTGKTPFDAPALLQAGLDELRRTIREREPARPSTRLSAMPGDEQTTTASRRGMDAARLVHLLRGDLDWIVMKCLEKDREQRYETASGLARDIGRHLEHEPIQARPPSATYRARKFVRRHRAAVAAVAAIAVVLVLGTVTSAWLAMRATRAKSEALQSQQNESRQRLRAESTASELHDNVYSANMGEAFQAWESDRVQVARELLDQHGPVDRPDLRGFEWRFLHGLTRPTERFVFASSSVQSVSSALSPDDRVLALGGFDGRIDVWDIERRQVLGTLRAPPGTIYSVEFSPDGQTLASTLASSIPDANGSIQLWDMRSLAPGRTLRGHTKMTAGLAFSPDGRLLASVASELYNTNNPAEIFLWDLESGSKRSELTGHASSVGYAGIAFSPNGRWLATAHGDGFVRLWDISSGKVVRTLEGHRGLVLAARFSPDGHQIASAGMDGTVRLWPLDGNSPGEIIGRHVGPVYCLSFSPEGKRLVSGGLDKTVRVWDLERHEESKRLLGHADRIWNLQFARDGNRLITGAWDNSARLWDLEATNNPGSQVFPYPHGRSVAFSPDSRWMIWGGRFWRVDGMVEMARIPGDQWSYAPDGQQFVTRGAEPGFQVWAVNNGAPRHLLSIATRTNLSGRPAFSPDGKLLAMVRGGTEVVVWSTENWRELGSVHEAELKVTTTAFSTDGKWLATAFQDGGVRLWEAGRRTQGRLLAGHRLEIKNLAFSPDQRWLATASMDRTVRLWELDTGRSFRLPGHSGWMVAVAFSPDSRTLAAGTLNGEVMLWNVSTRRSMVTLRGHITIVEALEFSRDHRLLASVGGETLRLWHAPTLEETDAAR